MSLGAIFISILVVAVMVKFALAKPDPNRSDYVRPVDRVAGGYPPVGWVPYAIPVVIVIGIVLALMMLSAKPG